jgi:hypothetical protein
MNTVVFEEDWIEQTRKRYDNGPRHRKPLPYLIATDVECRTLRIEVEALVADLPALSQADMVPKLRSEENFWQTYHELVVGSFLKKRGLQIEYHKEIASLTPDWFVSTSDGAESIVVEVFTKNISSPEAQQDRQLADLRWRLADIRIDAELKISFKGTNRHFDSRRNKQIAVRLKQWLEGGDSQTGARLCVEALEFQVINRNRGFSKIQWIGFSESSGVIPLSLRKNLRDKAKKYGRLAFDNRLPLVLAVVAASGTGYDLEEFENILLGHSVYDVANDARSVQGVTRKNDSLFDELPNLSGALLARKGHRGEWEMKGFVNRRAFLPLCSEFATALCSEQAEGNS